MARRGDSEYQPRIPPGWRLANVKEWPINTMHGPGPRPVNWHLQTLGLVKEPISLKYEEFVGLPSVTNKYDHHCIDGWSYLGNEWTGVDMQTIIEMTQPKENVRYIHVEGERGYSATFPLKQELLLAYKHNGAVLPRAGGFPVRLVAPGEFGYRSVKWVQSLKFISEWEEDFWNKKLIDWGLPPIDPTLNPWTIDNVDRKAGLQKLFTHLLDDMRREKAARYSKKSSSVKEVPL